MYRQTVTPEKLSWRQVDIVPPPWSVEWIRRVHIKCMLFWWRLLYMTECRLLKENKRFPLIPRAPKPQSPDSGHWRKAPELQSPRAQT